MLVGNKLDLCEEDQKCRAVAYKNAEELAEVFTVCVLKYLLSKWECASHLTCS
jgi:hypothetical protein